MLAEGVFFLSIYQNMMIYGYRYRRSLVMLSCKTLRAGILASALLLVSGLVTELLTGYGLLPTVSGSYLGFFLAVAAVLTLLGLFLISLLPAVARRLAECER